MLKILAADQRALLYSTLLEAFRYGHQITATNYAQIVEMAELIRPNLIIIDHTLNQVGDGQKTAAELKDKNFNVVVLYPGNPNVRDATPGLNRQEILVSRDDPLRRAWAVLLHRLNSFLPIGKRVGDIWIAETGGRIYIPLTLQGHNAICFKSLEQMVEQLPDCLINPHLTIIEVEAGAKAPPEAEVLSQFGHQVLVLSFESGIKEMVLDGFIARLPSSWRQEQVAAAIRAQIRW